MIPLDTPERLWVVSHLWDANRLLWWKLKFSLLFFFFQRVMLMKVIKVSFWHDYLKFVLIFLHQLTQKGDIVKENLAEDNTDNSNSLITQP